MSLLEWCHLKHLFVTVWELLHEHPVLQEGVTQRMTWACVALYNKVLGIIWRHSSNITYLLMFMMKGHCPPTSQ